MTANPRFKYDLAYPRDSFPSIGELTSKFHVLSEEMKQYGLEPKQWVLDAGSIDEPHRRLVMAAWQQGVLRRREKRRKLDAWHRLTPKLRATRHRLKGRRG